MRRRLEETAYTHTHTHTHTHIHTHTHTHTVSVICPRARDCWEGSGSRWSAMALIVSGCGNGKGEACPVQPWPGDAITTSCVSVTVNPFAIIKASPLVPPDSGEQLEDKGRGGEVESSRRMAVERLSCSNTCTQTHMHVLWQRAQGQIYQTMFSV